MKNGITRARLGELFTFQNGRGFSKSEWSTRGLPIIRIQNLNSQDAPFNYFEGDYSPDIFVRPGDLLFSWSGTVGSSFGPHVWGGAPGLLNQHIFKVALSQNIEKRFAYYGLMHITEEIEQSVNGSVGLVHITKEKLVNFTLPLPPLPEQQRIVGILDQAFAAIATAKANTEKNLQNARALFESSLKFSLEAGGEGWITTTIGSQVTLQRGFDITKAQQEPGDIPVVSSGGIKSYHNAAPVRGPGVVMGRKGTLGKVYFVESDFWPHDTTLWVKEFKGNVPRFVYYFFSAFDVSRMDTGTANPALNRNQVHPIKTLWPPVAQQKMIVAKLDLLDAESNRLAALHQRKLAALDNLKKSILHHAFTGQL